MKNWEEYKAHLKMKNPEKFQGIAQMEGAASIISAIIQRRIELGMSQRKLAEITGLPQPSIARIESFRTIPKLDTLLKIMKPLGMSFKVKVL